MKDDRREELIGKTVFGVTYLFFALRMTALFSAVALIVLLIIGKPLWLSPLIGTACFLIYRFFRILVFRLLIGFGRWANK
jgi:uncharacterized membrane protein